MWELPGLCHLHRGFGWKSANLWWGKWFPGSKHEKFFLGLILAPQASPPPLAAALWRGGGEEKAVRWLCQLCGMRRGPRCHGHGHSPLPTPIPAPPAPRPPGWLWAQDAPCRRLLACSLPCGAAASAKTLHWVCCQNEKPAYPPYHLKEIQTLLTPLCCQGGSLRVCVVLLLSCL